MLRCPEWKEKEWIVVMLKESLSENKIFTTLRYISLNFIISLKELKATDVPHVTKDGVTAIIIAGEAFDVHVSADNCMIRRSLSLQTNMNLIWPTGNYLHEVSKDMTIYECISIYIYIYVCVCVCMYVYIYVYTRLPIRKQHTYALDAC